MYGEVTSRNHQAYSWGHLVRNNSLYISVFKLLLNVAQFYGLIMRLCILISWNSQNFFPLLWNTDIGPHMFDPYNYYYIATLILKKMF